MVDVLTAISNEDVPIRERAVDLAGGRVLFEVVADVDVAIAQQAGGQDEVMRFVAGQTVPIRRAPPICERGGEERHAGTHGNRRPPFTRACQSGH